FTQMALGKVRTREILNRQIWIRDNPDDQRVSQWTHEISELNDIAIAYLGDESVLQRNGDSQIIAHYKTDRKVALNQVGEVNQSATLLDLLTRILHTSFDNNQLTFDQLSAGHSAFLHIMIDLFVRTEQIRKALEDNTFNPAGIVIIDEPEIHLHLSVQSQILPLLSQQFPNIQFIVATHSPAIIASLENAVVYDVGTKKEVSD
ncbi:MAG: AAA family ATPase, partial [Algicola sp.]|nr:AAA family ATPase [Algicola sp.]